MIVGTKYIFLVMKIIINIADENTCKITVGVVDLNRNFGQWNRVTRAK